MNDTVFEITESLNATLSFPGGIALPRVSITQETTQITILDDDCEWIYETFHAHLRPVATYRASTAMARVSYRNFILGGGKLSRKAMARGG